MNLTDKTENELREEFSKRRESAAKNDGRLTAGSSAQLDYDFDTMEEINAELHRRGLTEEFVKLTTDEKQLESLKTCVVAAFEAGDKAYMVPAPAHWFVATPTDPDDDAPSILSNPLFRELHTMLEAWAVENDRALLMASTGWPEFALGEAMIFRLSKCSRKETAGTKCSWLCDVAASVTIFPEGIKGPSKRNG